MGSLEIAPRRTFSSNPEEETAEATAAAPASTMTTMIDFANFAEFEHMFRDEASSGYGAERAAAAANEDDNDDDDDDEENSNNTHHTTINDNSRRGCGYYICLTMCRCVTIPTIVIVTLIAILLIAVFCIFPGLFLVASIIAFYYCCSQDPIPFRVLLRALFAAESTDADQQYTRSKEEIYSALTCRTCLGKKYIINDDDDDNVMEDEEGVISFSTRDEPSTKTATAFTSFDKKQQKNIMMKKNLNQNELWIPLGDQDDPHNHNRWIVFSAPIPTKDLILSTNGMIQQQDHQPVAMPEPRLLLPQLPPDSESHRSLNDPLAPRVTFRLPSEQSQQPVVATGTFSNDLSTGTQRTLDHHHHDNNDDDFGSGEGQDFPSDLAVCEVNLGTSATASLSCATTTTDQAVAPTPVQPSQPCNDDDDNNNNKKKKQHCFASEDEENPPQLAQDTSIKQHRDDNNNKKNALSQNHQVIDIELGTDDHLVPSSLRHHRTTNEVSETDTTSTDLDQTGCGNTTRTDNLSVMVVVDGVSGPQNQPQQQNKPQLLLPKDKEDTTNLATQQPASGPMTDNLSVMVVVDGVSGQQQQQNHQLQLPKEKEDTTMTGSLDCDICLLPYEKGQVVAWSNNVVCTHCFHLDCIADWLVKHQTCPNCRAHYI